MMRRICSTSTVVALIVVTGTLFAWRVNGATPTSGPVIVPRNPNDASIHEGPSNVQPPGYRQDVNSQYGLLPASYDWFGGVMKAIGSIFQPFAADPTLLSYQNNGQSRFYAGYKDAVSRLYQGFKGLGGKNVTDVAQLGQACGTNPGDPYWVGYPRPGNVENPPPFQPEYYQYDCFCRCGEQIDCPIPGPYLHINYGGTNRERVACETCFGTDRIRKHDIYVGTDHGSFPGYPAIPADPGYQECLRESVESYATSGSGGAVQGPAELYGL